MPLKRCTKDGNKGWKFGDEGKCYTGPDAKKKATKQGLAIDPDYFKNKATKEEKRVILEDPDISILTKAGLFYNG